MSSIPNILAVFKHTFQAICIASLLVFFSVSPSNLFGVPAFPGIIEYKQPCGSLIEIYLVGDERISLARTAEGYSLLALANGEMQYAVLDPLGDLVPSGIAVSPAPKKSDSEIDLLRTLDKNLFYSERQIELLLSVWDKKTDFAKSAFPTIGQQKIVCILMQTPDLPFIRSREEFLALFNQLNYTLDGATGSLRDYYLENSWGQLDLIVDVFGPYTASQNMSHYGTPGMARQLVIEGINLANPHVNFADYDLTGNGFVDGLHMIFSGYGRESTGIPNTIWSHASMIIPSVFVDGVQINRYSCSPERRGNPGINPTGAITRIGVIGHEIGHVLGAPDFYDTDGGESGGHFHGTGYWDMMALGVWNNLGATPAHHNPYTKIEIYQWAQPNILLEPFDAVMPNTIVDNTGFYRINTPVPGEYFLLENRQHIGFDSHLPGHGLMIYHVHSQIKLAGNDVNAGHPQNMYPIHAAAAQAPNSFPFSYGDINSEATPFPGSANITQFNGFAPPYMRSWENFILNAPISNITENNFEKTISFSFMDVAHVDQWLSRDDGHKFKRVGTGSGGLFQAAIRYTPDQIAYFQSIEIAGIKTYVVDNPISARVKIWQGSDASNLTEVLSQEFVPKLGQWNLVELAIPYSVNMDLELWIGVEYDDPGPGVFPAGRDQFTNFDGYGNLVRLDVNDPDGWTLLTDYNVPGDWNIRAIMETGKDVEFFQVALEALPPQGGAVQGSGLFLNNTHHTIKAIASSGFQFINWTENDQIIAETPELSFFVIDNRNLKANFTQVTNIAEIESLQPGVNVFPNPSSGLLNISFTGEFNPEARVYLYSIEGKRVADFNQVVARGSNIAVDIRHLPPGVYILSLESNDYRIVRKVVKSGD